MILKYIFKIEIIYINEIVIEIERLEMFNKISYYRFYLSGYLVSSDNENYINGIKRNQIQLIQGCEQISKINLKSPL